MVRAKLETSEMTAGRALAATALALSLAAPLGVSLAAGTGGAGFPRRLRRAAAWLADGDPRLPTLCGARS